MTSQDDIKILTNENLFAKSMDFISDNLGVTSLSIEKNRKNFENYLIYAKGGLLVFLLLVTAIYQIYYVALYDVQNPSKRALNHTFLNDSRRIGSVFLDALINGVLGVVSSMIINVSRGESILRGFVDDKGNFTIFSTYIIIFTILSLFTICEEGSGFNRYLSSPDEYDELDGKNADDIKKENEGGNPFLLSVHM